MNYNDLSKNVKGFLAVLLLLPGVDCTDVLSPLRVNELLKSIFMLFIQGQTLESNCQISRDILSSEL